MVVVKLLGGLGNQMFQYATGRAVAQRLGVPLLLDTGAFARYELRRYELKGWALEGCTATPEEIERALTSARPPTWPRRLVRKLGISNSTPSVYKEPSFTYSPGILQVRSPVYLDGYWQSERYFSSIADALRQEFTLRNGPDEPNRAVADTIRGGGVSAVSLHVRRGDYVSNPKTAQYHGSCSLDYYRAAVDYIAERVSSPHFFVFSDDLAWARENLRSPHAMTLVDVNGPDKGVFDMALMKACRHHVIANSSFSWWGAWLNPHPGKIVVAPARWFNEATHDTRDLVPDSWVRL